MKKCAWTRGLQFYTTHVSCSTSSCIKETKDLELWCGVCRPCFYLFHLHVRHWENICIIMNIHKISFSNGYNYGLIFVSILFSFLQFNTRVDNFIYLILIFFTVLLNFLIFFSVISHLHNCCEVNTWRHRIVFVHIFVLFLPFACSSAPSKPSRSSRLCVIPGRGSSYISLVYTFIFS